MFLGQLQRCSSNGSVHRLSRLGAIYGIHFDGPDYEMKLAFLPGNFFTESDF